MVNIRIPPIKELNCSAVLLILLILMILLILLILMILLILLILLIMLMRWCCWLSDFVTTPPLSIIFDILKHVRSIFTFDPNCICVFVHICVFGRQTLGNIVFEVLVSFPFQKYITSWVFSGFSCSRAISGLGMGLGMGLGWVGSLCDHRC